MDVKKNFEKIQKRKERKCSFLQLVLFCSWCYSAAWIQGDITAQVSEATHSIVTITVNIQIKSNQTTDSLTLVLRGAVVWWKWRNMKKWLESKRKKNQTNKNEDSPLAFLMIGAKWKWMLQLLFIYIRWSNKNALILLSIYPHISLSQINTPVFSTPLLTQNSPVSSRL